MYFISPSIGLNQETSYKYCDRISKMPRYSIFSVLLQQYIINTATSATIIILQHIHRRRFVKIEFSRSKE